MCDCDYTHLTTTRVRARKAHRCFGCLRPIAVGTVHDVSAAVSDGYVYRYREHDECRQAARDLGERGECYLEGWLLEMAADEHKPPPDCLTGEARLAWLGVVGDADSAGGADV